MNPLKTYLGISSGADVHTGTSGFTNYFNNKPNPEAVFKDFPDAVIVDGDDDWSAPLKKRPASVVAEIGFPPLAWFHSGISGITKSGVVLTEDDFNRLCKYYEQELGVSHIEDLLTIYRRG